MIKLIKFIVELTYNVLIFFLNWLVLTHRTRNINDLTLNALTWNVDDEVTWTDLFLGSWVSENAARGSATTEIGASENDPWPVTCDLAHFLALRGSFPDA